jgi:Tol biopolymer transport system component
MGVVWKALDTKLDREIAVKILPEELAADPERLARFEREAKAVAALDHPNIVTLYSVEEAEGVHFITMGLVRGRSLTELIPKNGLPLGKFFDHAIALADAISAAHQQGITHRDLKPDNVMIGDDGRLKVLDFGLAKLREEAQGVESSTQLPTATVTQEGKILGTVSYMSPEQAEGKAIDHRSDIFSLGVMLYQMATGQRPFKGDTSVSIISSIMKETPASITDLNQTLPRHLGRIVRQCLQKEPDRRYQTARDLCNQLVELKEEVDSGEITPAGVAAGSGPRKRSSLIIGLAAIAVVVVVAGYFLIDRWLEAGGTESAPPNPSFTQLTSQPGHELLPSLSPDGEFVVFVSKASGNWDIYLQRVGGEKAINLTEDCPDMDSQPAFSPDGTQIAFRSKREGGGIFVMGATGESVKRLTDFGGNPAWSPDGKEILIAEEEVGSPWDRMFTSKIWAIDITSGDKRLITEEDAVQPHWSPHGDRIAYWSLPPGGGQRDIWTVPATGGEPTQVTNDAAVDWNPVWSPDGRFLYFSSDRGGSMNIWRLPINEATGEVLGSPQPITTGGTASHQHLSFSSDGRRLAYVEVVETANIHKTAFDPTTATIDNRSTPVTYGSMPKVNPSVSPDGEWLTFQSWGIQEDIFVIRADGTGLRQLTDDIYKDREPYWSPNGERIAFFSERTGNYEAWLINPDGSGLQQLTATPESFHAPGPWSPDGSRLIVGIEPSTKRESLIMDLGKSWEEQTLEALPPVSEASGGVSVHSWSPDGQWLVGHGFHPDGTSAGIFAYSLERGLWQQLLDFGGNPVWLHDSRRLLFQHEGKLFLLDTVSKDYREILRPEPPAQVGQPTIAPDNRTIYFTHYVSESDIWMLTLE